MHSRDAGVCYGSTGFLEFEVDSEDNHKCMYIPACVLCVSVCWGRGTHVRDVPSSHLALCLACEMCFQSKP